MNMFKFAIFATICKIWQHCFHAQQDRVANWRVSEERGCAGRRGPQRSDDALDGVKTKQKLQNNSNGVKTCPGLAHILEANTEASVPKRALIVAACCCVSLLFAMRLTSPLSFKMLRRHIFFNNAFQLGRLRRVKKMQMTQNLEDRGINIVDTKVRTSIPSEGSILPYKDQNTRPICMANSLKLALSKPSWCRDHTWARVGGLCRR